jgi:hypothetical protein
MKTLLLATLALAVFAKNQDLGKPLTLKESMNVGTVVSTPEPLVGKTVQVKGKVTEVCEMAGCWAALVDPETSQMIRVKVNDGDIVFPKEAVGKLAIAEGTLKKLVLTKEQAIARMKHEADEQGRKFDASKVTSGMTIFQIAGTGARILE